MSWLREVMAGDGFDLCHVYVPGYDNVVPVTYNPYTFSTFVEKTEENAPVYRADSVAIRGRSILAVNPVYDPRLNTQGELI